MPIFTTRFSVSSRSQNPGPAGGAASVVGGGVTFLTSGCGSRTGSDVRIGSGVRTGSEVRTGSRCTDCVGRRDKVMRSIIGSSGHGASLADGRIPDAFVKWRVALQRHTPSMRSERAGLRAIIGSDGWRPSITMADSELAAIEHPTLLIQGSADPTAPAALWERVMRLLPQGEWEVVEGAGHQPWLDAPERVGAQVSNFLRGDPAATPVGESRSRLPP